MAAESNKDTLPTTNNEIINKLINTYENIFKGLGKCNSKNIRLHLREDAKPIAQPTRPIPLHLKKRFDDEVQDMISKGVFEEHKGLTEWLSNLMIVPKDDGQLQITVDYRSLNKSLLNTHDLWASMLQ